MRQRPFPCVMVASLVLAALAARAEEPGPLTLCLAPAADGSPTYPLRAVPASNRELVVVFRLRPGESFAKLDSVWTAVDVGDAAPANAELARGELRLGAARSGHFRYSLPRDFPVGRYRLDVTADGKPWASLDFAVVAAEAPQGLQAPTDLLPLAPGTTWSYAWVLEAGSAAKNVAVEGTEKGSDGRLRTTTTFTVAGKDEAGARIEMRGVGTHVVEEWWSLTATGLAVTQTRRGGAITLQDPPRPLIALPLQSPFRWVHNAKGGPATEYRMWGPHPVRTPGGEKPGWIVWSKTVSGPETTTIERHFAPGVGIVREVHVHAVGPNLLTRVETELLPAQ